MASWLIVFLLLALGLCGYRLMGGLDRFWAKNLDRAAPQKTRRAHFTFVPDCFIMEDDDDTEGGAADDAVTAEHSAKHGQAG